MISATLGRDDELTSAERIWNMSRWSERCFRSSDWVLANIAGTGLTDRDFSSGVESLFTMGKITHLHMQGVYHNDVLDKDIVDSDATTFCCNRHAMRSRTCNALDHKVSAR